MPQPYGPACSMGGGQPARVGGGVRAHCVAATSPSKVGARMFPVPMTGPRLACRKRRRRAPSAARKQQTRHRAQGALDQALQAEANFGLPSCAPPAVQRHPPPLPPLALQSAAGWAGKGRQRLEGQEACLNSLSVKRRTARAAPAARRCYRLIRFMGCLAGRVQARRAHLQRHPSRSAQQRAEPFLGMRVSECWRREH